MSSTSIVRLSSWNEAELRPFLNPLHPSLLEPLSILVGHSPGTVYVDRVHGPRAVLVCGPISWYVLGEPSRGFLSAANRLLPLNTYRSLVLVSPVTSQQLATLIEGFYFVPAESRYAERTEPYVDPSALVEGVDVRPIDRSLLALATQGVRGLVEEILETWASVEAFCDLGFGFAAFKDDELVCRSFTDYVVAGCCEIGIWTAPDQRLKGLGRHIATRTANEAFRRGLRRVGWMSWANNTGSVAVSARAGFCETCVYEILINHWPAENVADLPSEAYRAFAEEYERRFAQDPPQRSGYPHIVAATAWALARDGVRCRRQLESAIDMGWLTSIEQLRGLWPELLVDPAIYGRPEWYAVLSRLTGCP